MSNNKRPVSIYEIPCLHCPRSRKCIIKVEKAPALREIVDFMFQQKNGNFEDCSIYQAIIWDEELKKEEKE